jgi:NDP-sugar pyrophosphorylase family protein
VDIAGMPLLTRQINFLREQGVKEEDIGVNTCHLSDVVLSYLSTIHPDVFTTRETDLLGTGGALRNFRGFIGQERFVVMLCDTLTDLRLDVLTQAHAIGDFGATITVDTVDHETAASKGVVFPSRRRSDMAMEVGRVSSFLEKPTTLTSNSSYRVWSGMAVMEPAALKLVNNWGEQDITEIFNTLSGLNALGYVDPRHEWLDIGTQEQLGRSNEWLSQRKMSSSHTIL